MPLPIAGEIEVEVTGSAPVSIHGDLYADLAVLVPGDAASIMTRIPVHVLPVGEDGKHRLPGPGDRLILRVLLGQVDGVRALG
jgi:hypothetical protein